MVAWKGVEQKYHHLGVLHKTKIPRKPVSHDIELKTTADGETGILMEIDIVEENERQRQKTYAAEFSEGTALTLRLAAPFNGTGRTMVADSVFSSVNTLVQLERLLGLYFMGIVKDATAEYPKSEMLAWFYELPPRGSFKILESTNPLNTNMYALCWADKKPKRIIVSRGTPLPGGDSVRCWYTKVMSLFTPNDGRDRKWLSRSTQTVAQWMCTIIIDKGHSDSR
ncbi:hypothetical protein Pcac1_g6509 [Phytophthora cactorum]|nr:hypothetical protein Pcac1_g6509 [Phytophthora cactorum]KAG2840132.1 hypothetical protein PC112_g3855 [Phytophthora cactorum]KAG2846611.1 hypothetical protein PC111_g1126 [Phytophthora cactorum]KAG2866188.1 hypothetical protein PC113_g3042 [Phytophthora cactorum]KAG2989724.1 hypothetical protein PC118_g5992 [Phytophthora cactorum]